MVRQAHHDTQLKLSLSGFFYLLSANYFGPVLFSC